MQPSLQLALPAGYPTSDMQMPPSLFSRLGIPPILGELLVWASVLGPGATTMLHLRLFDGGSGDRSSVLLASTRSLVLMFVAGIETDIDRMREASLTPSSCTPPCQMSPFSFFLEPP